MKKSNVRIEWVTDLDRIGGLEEQWLGLEKSVNKRTIHSSFDWVFPWYKHLANGDNGVPRSPLLGTAWNGNNLYGLAPLVKRKRKFGGVTVQSIDPAGYDAEAGEFLVPDNNPELIGEFVDSIVENIKFNMIRLNSCSQNSKEFAALKDAVKRNNLSDVCVEYFYGLVDLQSGYTEYYTSRSSRYRRNLRIQEEKLNKNGGWKVETFTSSSEPRELKSALARMVSIYNSSWKAAVGESLPPAYQSFYEDISRRFASKEMLHLSILSIDSKDAGYFLALTDRGVLYDVFVSYDRSFKSLRPGEFLVLQLLKMVPEKNIHTVVSHGAHEYKRVWATEFVPLTRIYIFSSSLKSFLCQQLRFKVKPLMRKLKS
jgi:CelD/BcsL family acetyltransferase involved in cellulose biosynthesis